MSHPAFYDKGNKLGRFIEECGEALAAAGKCVRFGIDSYNPLVPENQRERNRDWLKRELQDLKEAISQVENQL